MTSSSVWPGSGSIGEVPIVHDNAYSELTFDGYVAPSFLEAPGAKDAGIEMFSLSKAYNMTGWRVGAAVGNAEMIAGLWTLKTNIDSGMFDAIQMAAVPMLEGPQDFVARDARRCICGGATW